VTGGLETPAVQCGKCIGNICGCSVTKLDGEDQRRAEEDARREELRTWMLRKLTHEMIKSELTGFYEEVNKLVRILPKEAVTPLQLKIADDLVGRAKRLFSEDTAIDQVWLFARAAGVPEYRDMIVVLRQICQELERFEVKNRFVFSNKFDDEVEEYNL
jgi:hypothetical protein